MARDLFQFGIPSISIAFHEIQIIKYTLLKANAVQHVRDNFDCYLDALEVLMAVNQLDVRCLADAQDLLN